MHPSKDLAVSPLISLSELTINVLSNMVPRPFRVLASLLAPQILRPTGVTRYYFLQLALKECSDFPILAKPGAIIHYVMNQIIITKKVLPVNIKTLLIHYSKYEEGVLRRGIEPPRGYPHRPLKPARLPVPPPELNIPTCQ